MDFLDAVCLAYDVNPKWLLSSAPREDGTRGEDGESAEEPILLSRRYVRSSEKHIFARVRRLIGDETRSTIAKKTGIGVGVWEQYLLGNIRMNIRIGVVNKMVWWKN